MSIFGNGGGALESMGEVRVVGFDEALEGGGGGRRKEG